MFGCILQTVTKTSSKALTCHWFTFSIKFIIRFAISQRRGCFSDIQERTQTAHLCRLAAKREVNTSRGSYNPPFLFSFSFSFAGWQAHPVWTQLHRTASQVTYSASSGCHVLGLHSPLLHPRGDESRTHLGWVNLDVYLATRSKAQGLQVTTAERRYWILYSEARALADTPYRLDIMIREWA
jgi:hypothetical protein